MDFRTFAIVVGIVAALSTAVALLAVYFRAEERTAVQETASDTKPEPRPDEWSDHSLEEAEDETGVDLETSKDG